MEKAFDRRKWRNLGGVQQMDKLFDRQWSIGWERPFTVEFCRLRAIRKACEPGKKEVLPTAQKSLDK